MSDKTSPSSATDPRCKTCGDTGYVMAYVQIEPGISAPAGEPCPDCDGAPDSPRAGNSLLGALPGLLTEEEMDPSSPAEETTTTTPGPCQNPAHPFCDEAGAGGCMPVAPPPRGGVRPASPPREASAATLDLDTLGPAPVPTHPLPASPPREAPEYEIETFGPYRQPQTQVIKVRAFSAEDAAFQAKEILGMVTGEGSPRYVRVLGPAPSPPSPPPGVAALVDELVQAAVRYGADVVSGRGAVALLRMDAARDALLSALRRPADLGEFRGLLDAYRLAASWQPWAECPDHNARCKAAEETVRAKLEAWAQRATGRGT